MGAGINASLAALIARLPARAAGSAEWTAAELADWPAADVAALNAAGLLNMGDPARSAECPGCEHACYLPVDVVPRPGRAALLFIVCEKRDDIGRVDVPAAALERWRLTSQGLADVLARLLGSAVASPLGNEALGYWLGVVTGRKTTDKAAARLTWTAGTACLDVAGHALALPLVMDLVAGVLVLDVARLQRCVDAPAGTLPEVAMSAEDRRLQYVALLDQERRISLKGCLKRAVARAGIGESAFKQVVYRKPNPKRKPTDALERMAATVTDPGLPTKQNKR